MTEDESMQCYKEGYKAFDEGKPFEDCPYPKDEEHYEHVYYWQEGFLDNLVDSDPLCHDKD